MLGRNRNQLPSIEISDEDLDQDRESIKSEADEQEI
jgi:hypothetical protein